MTNFDYLKKEDEFKSFIDIAIADRTSKSICKLCCPSRQIKIDVMQI